VKIGPVDTEMALLIVKKEEITEGKIHSPIGRFAERAKKQQIFRPMVKTSQFTTNCKIDIDVKPQKSK